VCLFANFANPCVTYRLIHCLLVFLLPVDLESVEINHSMSHTAFGASVGPCEIESPAL
jgi:hypothetical protein